MITERDYYNMLITAKADGEAKGREEGRVEGRNEEKIRIAKALKENGVTGLSEYEIAML